MKGDGGGCIYPTMLLLNACDNKNHGKHLNRPRKAHLKSSTEILVDAPRQYYFLDTLILYLSLRIPNDYVEEILRNVPFLWVDRFHYKLMSAWDARMQKDTHDIGRFTTRDFLTANP